MLSVQWQVIAFTMVSIPVVYKIFIPVPWYLTFDVAAINYIIDTTNGKEISITQ